jgi:hypothetical protein
MFLSGVLFVLFLAGCWLYCLVDAALTPARSFRGLPKRAWLVLIAVTFIVGAFAWTVSRRPWRVSHWAYASAGHPAFAAYDDGNVLWYPSRSAATAEAEAAALARHPASRSKNANNPVGDMPIGPDDDPEFLAQLAERIRRPE